MRSDQSVWRSAIRPLGVVNLVLSGLGGLVWLPLSLVVGFSTDGGNSRFAANLSHAWTALGVASLLSFGVGLASVLRLRSRPLSLTNERLAVGANTLAVILFVVACAWLFPLVAQTSHF